MLGLTSWRIFGPCIGPSGKKPFSIMHLGAGQASWFCFLRAVGYELFGENTVSNRCTVLSFTLVIQDFHGVTMGWCCKEKLPRICFLLFCQIYLVSLKKQFVRLFGLQDSYRNVAFWVAFAEYRCFGGAIDFFQRGKPGIGEPHLIYKRTKYSR